MAKIRLRADHLRPSRLVIVLPSLALSWLALCCVSHPVAAHENTIDAAAAAQPADVVTAQHALPASVEPSEAEHGDASNGALTIALPPIEPAPLSLNLAGPTPLDSPVADAAPLPSDPHLQFDGSVATATLERTEAAPSDSADIPTGALASYAVPQALPVESADNGIYGPDLPNADLAKAILRRLGARKDALDDGIAEYYASHANQPLWLDGKHLKSIVQTALATLANAAQHGLRADAYPVSIHTETLDDEAASEVALTKALIRYARDARGARVNPRRISTLITAEPTIPAVSEILSTLGAANDVGAALEAFQPQQAGYMALKAKLAELRATPASNEPLPAELRKQASNEADLIANMERWRWMPRDLGETYILVNVPDYELSVMRGGVAIHRTKVIVGKPQTPTPIFSHAMEYLIVNPYWNIPPSIALKEMLPQLKADPFALQRKGFEIVRNGHTVDPSGVDWTGSIKSVRIRQPPGERNALGLIKFMFPNDHAVYLHDTPSRGLFAREARAFSHGCVRVFEPFTLAEILLDHQNGLTAQQLRAMVGKGERYIYLQHKIPVHIAYFTNVVDEAGVLRSKADIYGQQCTAKTRLGISALAVSDKPKDDLNPASPFFRHI